MARRKSLNKRAFDPEWWKPVGKNLAVGAGAGITAASLLNLLHQVKLERQRAALEKQPTETDEGTIVLTLPKQAEIVGNAATEPIAVGNKSTSTATSTRVPSKSYRSGYYSGASMKVGAAPWEKSVDSMQHALKYLGMGAGAVGGYKLVDEIFKARTRRMLQREEQEAKTELLDMLSGKTAGCEFFETLDSMAAIDQMGKEAILPDHAALAALTATPPEAKPKPKSNTKGPISQSLTNMGGMGILLGILGVGGTAYLTKKLLDAKAKEKEDRGYEPPRLKRVIFRSEPVNKIALAADEVPFDELDKRALDTAVVVMMEKISGDTDILNHPDVQAAMKEAGLTTRDLFQLVATDPAIFEKDAQMVSPYLQQNPQYREQLISGGVEPFIDTMRKNPTVMAPILEQARQKHPILTRGMDDAGLTNRVIERVRPELQDYYNANAAYPQMGAGSKDPYYAEVNKRFALRPNEEGVKTMYDLSTGAPATTEALKNWRQGWHASQANTMGGKAKAMGGSIKDMLGGLLGKAQGVDWGGVLQRFGPVALGLLATWLMSKRKGGAGRASTYMPAALGAGMSAWDMYGRPWPGQRPNWMPGPVTPLWGKTGGYTPKTAGLLSPVMSSVIGTSISRQITPEMQPKEEEEPITKGEARKLVREVDITALDPRAQAFLAANRTKIKKLLEQLALEGKV